MLKGALSSVAVAVVACRACASPNGTDLRPPNRTPCTGNPPIEVLVPDTSRDGRAGRGAPLTPRRAPGAPKCARRPCNDTQHAGDSKKFLVLFLWRFELGLCLNYLLQPPAWFEGNLNHLGAGAFEITSRMFLFERERVESSSSQTEDNIRHGVFHGGCSALIAHRFC